MTRRAKRITLPLIAWWLCMAIISSTPGYQLPQMVSFWEWDKFAHAFEFAVLAVLMGRFLISNKQWVFSTKKVVLITVAIGLVYAGFDEAHQLFIPNRTCSIFDWIADGLGILAGVAGFTRVPWVRKI